ncbi:MAG TPA: PsiF family protein, partial [Gammaproteobacteria bacterium]|nr:PsiF family protein [Gammaproteobacteria bacterium]
MKSLTVPAFIVLTILFALNQSAFAAATEGKPGTPQQERMATCSHESKGMKGDERKKFMSGCL